MRVIFLIFAIVLNLSQAAKADALPAKAQSVIAAISQITDISPEPFGENYCSNENYCGAYFGNTDVAIHGLGIVTISRTTSVPIDEYILYCAAAYSGLAGVDFEFAAGIVGTAFGIASNQGRYKKYIDTTEISIEDGDTDYAQCRFFRK